MVEQIADYERAGRVLLGPRLLHLAWCQSELTVHREERPAALNALEFVSTVVGEAEA
jgi:hypothetical protein